MEQEINEEAYQSVPPPTEKEPVYAPYYLYVFRMLDGNFAFAYAKSFPEAMQTIKEMSPEIWALLDGALFHVKNTPFAVHCEGVVNFTDQKYGLTTNQPRKREQEGEQGG